MARSQTPAAQKTDDLETGLFEFQRARYWRTSARSTHGNGDGTFANRPGRGDIIGDHPQHGVRCPVNHVFEYIRQTLNFNDRMKQHDISGVDKAC